MRPISVLNGILFGTAGSIALGLAVVLFLFLVLEGESPQLEVEYGPLLRTTGLFWPAALATGASFYGHLTTKPWRWWAQVAALASLAVVSWWFLR